MGPAIGVIIVLAIFALMFSKKKTTTETTSTETVDTTTEAIPSSATADLVNAAAAIAAKKANEAATRQATENVYLDYPYTLTTIPDGASWDAKVMASNADAFKIQEAMKEAGLPAIGTSIILQAREIASHEGLSIADQISRMTGISLASSTKAELAAKGIDVGNPSGTGSMPTDAGSGKAYTSPAVSLTEGDEILQAVYANKK